MSLLRSPAAWLLALPAVAAAWLYAPGFDGFWIGDDRSNLYLMHTWAAAGELGSRTLAQFAEGIPSQGAFYRPMMMLSLAANFATSGADYAGWYAFGFLAHLANTVMVGLLVLRLAQAIRGGGTQAAILAALLFGLCPFLAEGVYWVSARADACVTFLTLLGLYRWAGPGEGRGLTGAVALPLLLAAALGFKESAAVLPLQVTLVALAWPLRTTRAQRIAVLAAFAIVAGFFLFRSHLFGNPWQVYRASGGAEATGLAAKLAAAVASLGPWWEALGRATPGAALAYPALLAAGACALLVTMDRPQARLALAFAAASGGLALATFANLGSLAPSGEGGRLAYGPVAWMAVALGIACVHPFAIRRESRWQEALRTTGGALLVAALVAGLGAALAITGHAFAAQRSVKAMTALLPAWAEANPGLTMLVVPENEGFVVVNRNGQGGLVFPPLQSRSILDRVVPTLPSEIDLRYGQFLEPAAAWPARIACWSSATGHIVPIAEAPREPREQWVAATRRDISACGL